METNQIQKPNGVRDLREELVWYRNGKSRGSEGIPAQIVGVWDIIVGKQVEVNGKTRYEGFTSLLEDFHENAENLVGDDLSESDVRRVIGLLQALQDTESEYRVYGEDREREGRFDYRTRCWVGQYHVTDKTTIVVYLHKTFGMGYTTYDLTGVASPRRDIEEWLQDEVFFQDKYDYSRLE